MTATSQTALDSIFGTSTCHHTRNKLIMHSKLIRILFLQTTSPITLALFFRLHNLLNFLNFLNFIDCLLTAWGSRKFARCISSIAWAHANLVINLGLATWDSYKVILNFLVLSFGFFIALVVPDGGVAVADIVILDEVADELGLVIVQPGRR